MDYLQRIDSIALCALALEAAHDGDRESGAVYVAELSERFGDSAGMALFVAVSRATESARWATRYDLRA